MTTTNNKDFPPTTLTDVDAQIAELRAEEEKQKNSDINLIGGLLSMSKTKEDLLKMDFDEEDIDEAIRRQDPLYNTAPKSTEPAPEPAHQEESEDLKPLDLDEEPVVPTVEDKRTPEEKKVDDARDAYVKEYLRCKKIAKAKGSVLNAFKSQEKKEAKYLDQEYKDKKKVYDDARAEWSKELLNTERIRLEASGLSGAELERELQLYNSWNVLNKTHRDELIKLGQKKAEGSPMKPILWKKALNWYVKQPRWKKVAMSTAIFTGVSIATAGGATASIAGVALGRFARGMAGGVFSSSMTKLVDVWNRKRNDKFEETSYEKESELRDKFSTGEITLEQYEKGHKELEVSAEKRKRNQTLAKLAVGGIASAGFGYGSSHIGNVGSDWFHKQPGVPQDNTTGIGGTADSAINKTQIDTAVVKSPIPTADTATTTTPDNNITNPTDSVEVADPVAPADPTQSTPDANTPVGDKVVAEVGKGHGAIKTIEEFQEKLKAQYPDASTAPVSVQHILNTKPDRLAIEYGMFKPGDDAESAVMKLGSKFESDAQGNISFTQEGKTTLLEKGDDADVTNVYGGKMIDGDNSGRTSIASEPRTSGTSKFLEQNPQKDPVGAVDATTPKADDGTSEFLKNNPQKDPVGSIETEKTPAGVKAVTEPVEGTIKPKIEELKSNLTASRLEDISPTKNAFDNSYGTNTETISPTSGVYNTGAGSSTSPNFASSREVAGNGFTTENPMTNEALAEKEILAKQNLPKNENAGANNNAGNIIENQSPNQVSINQDPRHADSLEQARDRFGRSNIEIEKPEGDYTNGIKHENWNKAADNMFKAKNVKFDSFESYEKEDELQRLLGSAKQEVKYVQSIDKNAEVVTMDYFREQPEWKTIDKIPAKYFLNSFEEASFADGTPIPKSDLDNLVAKGIIRENINVTPGQATTTSYSFKNQAELERLSKTYGEVLSNEDISLGNDKPIGDENLEKYVARMTKRVYTADDGTMFAPKEKFVPSTQPTPTTSQGYETMRADRVARSNTYNTNSGVISPTRGVYQTSSDYSLANRAVDNIFKRIFR